MIFLPREAVAVYQRVVRQEKRMAGKKQKPKPKPAPPDDFVPSK
jgi:hypothetical protein